MTNNTPRFVTSKDGTRIACYVQGDGPPLLLSYGALSDSRFWSRFTTLLQGYRLYIVERRGRGESGDSPEYAPRREAEDIVAVLEGIGEPAFVFAHSSGAVVGLAAMKMAPQLVRRAVLYEPPVMLEGSRPLPPANFAAQVKTLVDAGDRSGAMELFYRLGPALPEAEIQRQKERDLWRSLEPLAHTTVYDAQVPQVFDLEELSDPEWKVPTLLLHGEVSPSWVIDGVHALAANLGSSRVVALAKQGHVAMFTAPDLLAGEIKAFFESQ